MRVVFIQDHLRNGGTENQTIHLADGLAKSGHDLRMIVFREGGVLDQKAGRAAFSLQFLEQGALKTDWHAPGLRKAIEAHNPDVVIAMGRMANCHAGLLCRKDRKYTIVSTFRTGRSIPWLYRKALRESNYIIANSHEAKERLKTLYGINRPEVDVIYNGCIRNFETFIPALRPMLRQNGAKSVRICCVAMFRTHKGQARLLKACSLLPADLPWRLVLAGDGPELINCITLADELGIANRVDFTGLLADPRALYFDSDIAALASTEESLPNFLVESQMACLPVVSYDTGGCCECFDLDKSGYLVPENTEAALAEKLAILIKDADLRLQMSEVAREYAKERFSPEAQLKAYQRLLRKLKP